MWQCYSSDIYPTSCWKDLDVRLLCGPLSVPRAIHLHLIHTRVISPVKTDARFTCLISYSRIKGDELWSTILWLSLASFPQVYTKQILEECVCHIWSGSEYKYRKKDVDVTCNNPLKSQKSCSICSVLNSMRMWELNVCLIGMRPRAPLYGWEIWTVPEQRYHIVGHKTAWAK